ncbi:MAG: tol-pal system protein [Paracoccus sp.]|uniref:tol-pal system protein n=1 Tax=Paracoccus sp. TaxID=267 RepID=UPI000C55560E|nr:tol-pal system protein [Paracoccus sp. (in: a-proteobacteria)]MBA49546.1 tol-pal system protein [Paracoccus sp. (in: a-proteobacteria)]
MHRTLAAAGLAVLLALPLAARADQDPTLADLRAELSQVRAELQSLRAQLVASGAAGFRAAGGDSAIDRMNAMETRLARLTDRTEQVQNRINGVLAESKRRMDDLEFRLCEMDETCDLPALMTPDAQGEGGTGTPSALAPAAPADRGAGAAGKPATAAEQADFDAARQVMNSGDFARAAQMFGAVAEKHAGGPLTAEALFLRGAALDSAGDEHGAAAAWLEGFAADPESPRAAESLLGIARVVANDDPTAACLYLAEIPARFPGTPPAVEAEPRMSRLACGANDLGGGDPGLSVEIDPEAMADMIEQQQ